jgi:hypothetical protein
MAKDVWVHILLIINNLMIPPVIKFDQEPGEAVNEGEAQVSQAQLIHLSKGKQDQQPQVQLRRYPRCNKISETSEPKAFQSPSTILGSKVLEVWYDCEAKWRTNFLTSQHVTYEIIQELVDIGEDQHPMLAFAATANPDTMMYYHHEAMRESDCTEFVMAMEEKQIQSQNEN